MPFLRKLCGGCSVLGYTWATDGQVVEVTDEHARILLSIQDADYTEVPAPAPATFSEVVNDTPAVNRPVQRPRPLQRRQDARSTQA